MLGIKKDPGKNYYYSSYVELSIVCVLSSSAPDGEIFRLSQSTSRLMTTAFYTTHVRADTTLLEVRRRANEIFEGEGGPAAGETKH